MRRGDGDCDCAYDCGGVWQERGGRPNSQTPPCKYNAVRCSAILCNGCSLLCFAVPHCVTAVRDGAGLEVSVDCSEHVLAALVHYLSSGVLLPLHPAGMPALALALLRQQDSDQGDRDRDRDREGAGGEVSRALPPMAEDLASSALELCRIASELGASLTQSLSLCPCLLSPVLFVSPSCPFCI